MVAAVVIATLREHKALESPGVSLSAVSPRKGGRELSVADMLRPSLLSRATAQTGGGESAATPRLTTTHLSTRPGVWESTHANVVTLTTGI